MKSRFRPGGVLLTLVVAAGVLALTHIPGQDIPRALQHITSDKLEHIVAYGLMAGSFLLSLRRPVRPLLLLLGLTALALLGALDETTQPFVNRTCDFRDYLSDLTGIALASILFLTATRLRVRPVSS